MMILDRKISPESHLLNNINVPQAKTITLDSGIPFHYFHDENTQVVKLEFVFDAGVRSQSIPFQASAVSQMISEGTKNYSSKQISENLDFYGAYVQQRCGVDDASLILYCTPKHIASCLPYIVDLLCFANFPENELDSLKKRASQRLLVNEEKAGFIARRTFYQTVFGISNPYGAAVNQQDIISISRETLLALYETCYQKGSKYILASGYIDDQIIRLVNSLFLSFGPKNHHTLIDPSVANKGKITKHTATNKPENLQSAIRIGRSFPTRHHKEYRYFQVLNLILGGYFGSRLMKNIREEKGLTYGIHSTVESYLDSGCFYIETEINRQSAEVGINEIYSELGRLRTEPINKEELEKAKSYMLGSFLRSCDGPFSLMDKYKMLIDFGFSYDYYKEFIEIIHSVTPDELQQLANAYLQEKNLVEIVVN